MSPCYVAEPATVCITHQALVCPWEQFTNAAWHFLLLWAPGPILWTTCGYCPGYLSPWSPLAMVSIQGLWLLLELSPEFWNPAT